jgi:hypothetical protein
LIAATAVTFGVMDGIIVQVEGLRLRANTNKHIAITTRTTTTTPALQITMFNNFVQDVEIPPENQENEKEEALQNKKDELSELIEGILVNLKKGGNNPYEQIIKYLEDVKAKVKEAFKGDDISSISIPGVPSDPPQNIAEGKSPNDIQAIIYHSKAARTNIEAMSPTDQETDSINPDLRFTVKKNVLQMLRFIIQQLKKAQQDQKKQQESQKNKCCLCSRYLWPCNWRQDKSQDPTFIADCDTCGTNMVYILTSATIIVVLVNIIRCQF